MATLVKCGLVQTAMACSVDEPLATIREANLAKTVAYIEQAAREGVQVLHEAGQDGLEPRVVAALETGNDRIGDVVLV